MARLAEWSVTPYAVMIFGAQCLNSITMLATKLNSFVALNYPSFQASYTTLETSTNLAIATTTSLSVSVRTSLIKSSRTHSRATSPTGWSSILPTSL